VSGRLAGVRVGPAGPGGPVTGWLTDEMVRSAGVPVAAGQLIRPQIVLVMRDRLAGPGVNAAVALAAVGSVLGGVEISGTEISGAEGSEQLVGGQVVVGPVAVPPSGLDLSLEACLLEVDGEITDSATGAAAVHGHPAQALALAANELGQRGQAIEPGWLVLAGGLTSPVSVRPGMSVAVHYTHLGSIFLSGQAVAGGML
jgi:2-oxo-3-hexenedioate decarboxylase